MMAAVQQKFNRLSGMMDERLRRHWAACEAMVLGHGGVSAVARARGMSRATIRRGVAEIAEGMPALAGELGQARVRRPGGGRHALAENDPGLLRELKKLLEASTRGDPTCALLLWTSKSTRNLAGELARRDHPVSYRTVARLLDDLGYSLQANRKTAEGKDHADRDAQFQHINTRVRDFQRRLQPVISVDTKKRELLGNFKTGGREWSAKGHRREVNTHDFRDEDLGIAIPYGVYDLKRNQGWVNVGIDHDTAQFAAESIRRWWRRMGRRAYPRAKELLITADAGGSNGSRRRLWKLCLQTLADELGLRIHVCHFPPGTSKWNKIEHRMFCHITENWRAQPLTSRAVIVNLIGHTTTREGLRIRAALDGNAYPNGIGVTDEQFASIRIEPDAFHGDWNYSISPRRPNR